MNIYLLKTVGKWLSFMVLSLSSLIDGNYYHEKNVSVNNLNNEKNKSVIHNVTKYNTEVIYDHSKPSDYEKVITEGQDGISYFDGKEEKVIKPVINKVVEKGYGDFVGRITGYGPDCEGCSGYGNVSCSTKNGGKHSLLNDGIYYNDEEFGSVRILAASLDGFPCGTIVEVSKDSTKFLGVVLDTGGSMRNAWSKGEVWMDLAYSSQHDARYNGIISGRNINYKVKRWGW